ncbi:Na+/H+ antiporter subunit A [Dermacoccaceae bacterium W4C1]
MIVLLLTHLVAACAAPVLVRRLGTRAFWLLALPPAALFVWALTQTSAVHEGNGVRESYSWVPQLGMSLTFELDALSWLMCLIVGGIGALVLLYCAHYFRPDSAGLGRFAGSLTGFAGAMLGLVTTDDLMVLYLFWETTTVLSFLLIGHRTTSRTSRAAAMQALVVTTAGGLAMLVGMILLGQAGGTYSISALLADPPTGTVVEVAVVLLLIGAISKSALVPFHFWLPGAMAAPTPVSAYLHAAAMVKAGIYLLARFAPGFADTTVWRPTILIIGGATMLIGALRALRQTDLKLVLAYGTVSQLGFMSMLVGTGSRDAALAGLGLLVSHALFKSSLFLTVGTIDHETGTRDLRKLNGLGRRMPSLCIGAVLAGMSMAGLPPLFGFFAKEAALGAFLLGPEYGQGPLASTGRDTLALAVIVIGSALTVAYTARFLWGAFADKPGEPTAIDRDGALLHIIPVLLGVGGLVAGLTGTLIQPYLEPSTEAWAATSHPVYLGGWHGFSAALWLSVAAWVLGGLLFWRRQAIERAQGAFPKIPQAEQVYRATMRGIDRMSLEVTGAVQRGSLPITLGLILTILVLVPGGLLLFGGVTWPQTIRWFDNPAQLAVAVVIVSAAVAATRARRRMRAVLLLGVTGYGAALLFLLHGAPDLALTQILVETVALVVFILVLRRLGMRFPDSVPWVVRRWRVLLGALAGLTMSGLALTAATVRTENASGADLTKSAKEFGGGSNIVNVILVDTRAWDTMGELSVVLVAATGIASLAFVNSAAVAKARQSLQTSRMKRAAGASRTPTGARRWLSSAHVRPERRSTIFEAVTRLIFHVMMMWSLFLLFSGHNHPGGGFAAGLVCGLALTVRYLAGSRRELLAAAPVMPGLLMGAGLFLSAGFGLASMAFGGKPLQSWIFDLELPLLGNVHLVTSLVFDIGVYLVVVGLMLDLLRSLGARLDHLIESADDPDSPEFADTATHQEVTR